MREAVYRALRRVVDPDLGRDIVSAGLVEQVAVEDETIRVKLKLTTPACPLKERFLQACRQEIEKEVGSSMEIEIEVGAETRGTRTAQQAPLLPQVKNIVAVASGKGGVGKSTVSVGLALALRELGARVGLLDADLYGPSIPLMTGLREPEIHVVKQDDKTRFLPVWWADIPVFSIGFLIGEGQAVIWRGPIASGTLRQFFVDVMWPELDYMVVDLPPGTGDIPMTAAQLLDITGAVIVTTPQKVSQSDVRRAISMFRHKAINKPVLGIVENMAYFVPSDMPERCYYLFGKGGGRALAEELGVPFLGEVPLVETLAELCDQGVQSVEQLPVPVREAFLAVAERLVRDIATLAVAHSRQAVLHQPSDIKTA